MEKYQIIPRKFRPQTFEEVFGHKAIVTTLKNALSQNRVGQAYLFCGARGCGKTTLARILAKALCCQTDNAPCNSCESCKEIASGRSLDVIEIDGASNRGIDDIRQINETVGYAPSKGEYKIYIIDEVHMLTKEAFNALLKTLEEPPPTVKFFFATTEAHKVPQTIISRCQRFNLGRIPEEALLKKLKHIETTLELNIEEEALKLVAQLGEGSLRDAESLLDQLACSGAKTLFDARAVFGLIGQDELSLLDEAILSGDTEKALSVANSLYQSGKDLASAIDGLLDHFRSHLLNPTTFSKGETLIHLETLTEWQMTLAKSTFKKVHLELLLLQIVRRRGSVPIDELVKRLENLQRGEEAPPPKPKPQQETPVETTTVPTEMPKPKSAGKSPSHYDTIIRFAATELDATVQQ